MDDSKMFEKKPPHIECEVSKHLDRIEHHEHGTEAEGDHLVQHDRIRYDFDPEIFTIKYSELFKITAVSILRVMLLAGLIFMVSVFLAKSVPLILM